MTETLNCLLPVLTVFSMLLALVGWWLFLESLETNMAMHRELYLEELDRQDAEAELLERTKELEAARSLCHEMAKSQVAIDYPETDKTVNDARFLKLVNGGRPIDRNEVLHRLGITN